MQACILLNNTNIHGHHYALDCDFSIADYAFQVISECVSPWVLIVGMMCFIHPKPEFFDSSDVKFVHVPCPFGNLGGPSTWAWLDPASGPYFAYPCYS